MLAAFRFSSFCFPIVAIACLSGHVQAAESEVPVDKRLEEIVAWAAADTDAATGRLIDGLSDNREIQGTTLLGQSKEIWTDLRSHTNVEITVSGFALHHLWHNTRRSKDLLAKKIQDLDQASKADRASDWLPADGHPTLRLLQALMEAHQRELYRQDIIPETQVIMEIKSKTQKNVIGVEVVAESSITIIAGYVDHRDKSFAKFVTGKTRRGRDQIKVTRSNLLTLANAIRDSHVKEDSP